MRRLATCSLSILVLLPAPWARGGMPSPPQETAPSVRPQTGAPPTVRPAGIDAAALDEILDTWLAPGNGVCDAPGAVLVVDAPSGRYLRAAGVARMQDQRPLEADDRLQIGSNTKAFTVILALQLEEEGALSMDDPVGRWLPEMARRLPNGAGVTLRHLAANTSGIRDYADPMMQPAIDAADREAIAKGYRPEELVEYAIANGASEFPPGDGWDYSSTNFILLGMVIEAAAQRPLAELYRERIFDPLGMAHTSYLEGSPAPGVVVHGYYSVPGQGLTDMTGWNATQGGAAGAIVSTAEDMARFASGLFSGALFEHDATLDEMLAFRELSVADGSGVMLGYGLGLISFRTRGFEAIGHAGQTPGFQSIWFRVPAADTTVAFLTNSGSCRVMLLPSSLAPEALGLAPSDGPARSTVAGDP